MTHLLPVLVHQQQYENIATETVATATLTFGTTKLLVYFSVASLVALCCIALVCFTCVMLSPTTCLHKTLFSSRCSNLCVGLFFFLFLFRYVLHGHVKCS